MINYVLLQVAALFAHKGNLEFSVEENQGKLWPIDEESLAIAIINSPFLCLLTRDNVAKKPSSASESAPCNAL